jgi:hypothetical protein
MAKPRLDEMLLGQRLPGTEAERKELLYTLSDLVDEEGEDWVKLNKDRLLAEAQFIVDEGILR